MSRNGRTTVPHPAGLAPVTATTSAAPTAPTAPAELLAARVENAARDSVPEAAGRRA
ncbi:hypothetical protein [Streptomyces sp. NPDC005805]|uniref:hypothetical protein n=1 Tax=Streptomyces sp. NPDC005805 TaxID=3157068 RepID=UPI0033FAD1E0